MASSGCSPPVGARSTWWAIRTAPSSVSSSPPSVSGQEYQVGESPVALSLPQGSPTQVNWAQTFLTLPEPPLVPFMSRNLSDAAHRGMREVGTPSVPQIPRCVAFNCHLRASAPLPPSRPVVGERWHGQPGQHLQHAHRVHGVPGTRVYRGEAGGQAVLGAAESRGPHAKAP